MIHKMGEVGELAGFNFIIARLSYLHAPFLSSRTGVRMFYS